MNSKQENTPINILLADDDPDDCFFFKGALEKLEMPTQLTIVNDGDQLMSYLSKNEEQLPDILFLDINMPRKNGFECLYEIKHNKKLKDLPIVMFSTTNERDAINTVFKNGVHIFITKPGDFEQLVQVIRHALPIITEQLSSNSKLKYILNA